MSPEPAARPAGRALAPAPPQLPAALEAVLWDMDGLLVDTEPTWTIAEQELAVRLGGSWDPELKAQIVGTRLDVAVPTILRWYGVNPAPAVVATHADWLLGRMVELFGGGIALLPGVADLLAALSRDGVPMALVSSSYRVLVDAVLVHGVGPFAVTVAGDEVVEGKPAPEPYLLACRQLGVDPSRCVVLEDSLAGVRSGAAAGCAVLAVPSVPGVHVAAGRRCAVRGTLAGVEVAELRELVAQRR